MYAKDSIVIHRHKVDGFHYADINAEFHTLYTTPLHADWASLSGWVADFRDALDNAMCLWCGEPLNYVTDVDDLEVVGFCSERDYTEALKESEDMARSER